MKRILFFGTSEFAVPTLSALAQDDRFEIIGVVTQPDRPVGRHAVLTPPPVKQWLAANELLGHAHGRSARQCSSALIGRSPLAVQQPEKIKDEDFQTWIKNIGPTCDAFVVVSYGKILPQWLLDLPKHGVVNVHGSLLPRWRGASPIQAAIAAGDTMSGVTIMKIDADMDHGPLLASFEEPIFPTDTGATLHDRLAALGGSHITHVLASYLDGTIQPQEQNHAQATHCKTLQREDGRLDLTKSAAELERVVRAYTPWPGTFIDIEGKRLKVLAAALASEQSTLPPGSRYTQDGKPHLVCGDHQLLELVTVQPEGKKPMSGSDFLIGNRF